MNWSFWKRPRHVESVNLAVQPPQTKRATSQKAEDDLLEILYRAKVQANIERRRALKVIDGGKGQVFRIT